MPCAPNRVAYQPIRSLMARMRLCLATINVINGNNVTNDQVINRVYVRVIINNRRGNHQRITTH